MVVFSGAEGREKNTRIGTKIGQTGAEGAVTPAKTKEKPASENRPKGTLYRRKAGTAAE